MTQFLERAVDRLYGYRLTVLVLLHVGLIVAANQAAFWLRFDGEVPPEQQPYDTALLPVLVLGRLAFFLPLRLHLGVWRYASVFDLRNIVAGVVLSSMAFWVIAHLIIGATSYPRSVFIIDSVLLVFLMGGARLGRRLYAASFRSGGRKRVLIYGAGDAGEMIARDMLFGDDRKGVPVGFLDDDPSKLGLKIHGIPVAGGSADVPEALKRFRPDEILIAIPTAEPKALRRILNAVQLSNVPIKTLPRLREIPTGKVSLNEVRDLSVADLLARAPVGLDTSRVRGLLQGQRVLVTGAGGSIGSELCRQILDAAPERLVLLDRHENSLFAIHAELCGRNRGQQDVLAAAIGDITDVARLDKIFATERPTVVFHAAAHKHVPLMEDNPSEAVKNNVRGTRLVAAAARRWKARRFVLISTDKAVNAASVMGATKQLAERLVQQLGSDNVTQFSTVRFGNVLGSNGSVVPTFLEQIKAGGPVTVTHPLMRRYFMLIPEAVQLVLHAAALGGQGGIYVLDMGEQVRVVDMARDLIRLAGYIPDKDIEVVFTGVRPGERLFEELVGSDERAAPSEVDKVQRVYPAADNGNGDLTREIEALEQLATEGDDPGVMRMLRSLIPSLAKEGEPVSNETLV